MQLAKLAALFICVAFGSSMDIAAIQVGWKRCSCDLGCCHCGGCGRGPEQRGAHHVSGLTGSCCLPPCPPLQTEAPLDLDYNRELVTVGTSNFITALAGVGYTGGVHRVGYTGGVGGTMAQWSAPARCRHRSWLLRL